MSHYWVQLKDEAGEVLKSLETCIMHTNEVLDESDDCSMSIPYNFGECWRLILMMDGSPFTLRWLDGKTGARTEGVLRAVVSTLGTNVYDKDYDAPTPGNVGYMAEILLTWAKEHPQGKWSVR